MRGMERELGCNATALYRYAESRDALLDCLVENVMAELVSTPAVVANPEEDDALLRPDLHRLPVGGVPHVRELAAELSTYDGLAQLDQGLDMLLTGLERQLRLGG